VINLQVIVEFKAIAVCIRFRCVKSFGRFLWQLEVDQSFEIPRGFITLEGRGLPWLNYIINW